MHFARRGEHQRDEPGKVKCDELEVDRGCLHNEKSAHLLYLDPFPAKRVGAYKYSKNTRRDSGDCFLQRNRGG